MDTNATAFKGVKANIKRINHYGQLDINKEYTGTMVLKRLPPHDIRALVHFTKPEEQQVFVGNGVADIYYPRVKTIQERKIGKYQTLFEQFYLLAFGGSGKDLLTNYDVTYAGSDDLGSHLQLIPKSLPDVKKSFSKNRTLANRRQSHPPPTPPHPALRRHSTLRLHERSLKS